VANFHLLPEVHRSPLARDATLLLNISNSAIFSNSTQCGVGISTLKRSEAGGTSQAETSSGVESTASFEFDAFQQSSYIEQ
jgi:hypothetical protein